MNFNKVIFGGRLTRDPQMKFTPSNTAVCEFGMCANRNYTKNNERMSEPCFVDVTAFGKPAEVINQYCRKGSEILVDGRLRWESWEDKNGGGKRSKLTVVVDRFEFAGGKSDGDAGGGSTSGDEPPFDPNTQIKDDDIPF